jgi:hypothetical protein
MWFTLLLRTRLFFAGLQMWLILLQKRLVLR